jgi:hypothetical protein
MIRLSYMYTHTVIRGGVLKPYLRKSRSITLCIDPFVNVQRAFYAGVPEAAEGENSENAE